MRSDAWTEREIAYLRRHYRTRTHREIAAALGRTVKAIQSYCKRFGFVVDRRIPEDLKRYVAANRHRPATEVARELGEPVWRIYNVRDRLGLTRKLPSFGDDFKRYLRAKHAEGWSDAEIASGWGCERHTIGDWRKRLGLADNKLSAHRIDRVRRKTAEQLRKAGLPSLAALRRAVFRERARREGWPEDLRPRAVQMLNALWEHGPMTRRQLAEVIGMPWLGSRKSLVSNDPEGSYLAHLQARGLVVRLGRIVRGGGKCKNVYLYSLPMTIERRKVS